MVIACCDSRVDPTIVFDAAPGELFVLRQIAALVPPCERDGKHHGASAAIEFAVTQLGVEHVVVFGHGNCGGIAASLSGRCEEAPECDGGFIQHWMEIIEPARSQVLAAAAIKPGRGRPARARVRVDPGQHRQSAQLPVRQGARE
ncbi:MAG: carbonic anhydrase [Pseudomonadota bacterium]